MLARRRNTYTYEVHAVPWVSRKYEALITELLLREYAIRQDAIQRGMHLTVYN